MIYAFEDHWRSYKAFCIQLKFTKYVVGFVKNWIEKKVWCGLKDIFETLLKDLQNEIQAKSKSSRTKVPPTCSPNLKPENQTNRSFFTFEKLTIFVIILIVALVITKLNWWNDRDLCNRHWTCKMLKENFHPYFFIHISKRIVFYLTRKQEYLFRF